MTSATATKVVLVRGSCTDLAAGIDAPGFGHAGLWRKQLQVCMGRLAGGRCRDLWKATLRTTF